MVFTVCPFNCVWKFLSLRAVATLATANSTNLFNELVLHTLAHLLSIKNKYIKDILLKDTLSNEHPTATELISSTSYVLISFFAV